MKFSNLLQTLLLLASAGSAAAQPEGFEYKDLLNAPEVLWTTTLFPNIDLGAVEIEAGNGIVMAPDGKHALVTTVGATVYAMNAYTGERTWVYQPEAVSNSIARSHGSVVFGPSADYMVYAVVDNENSLEPSSRVIALDMEGNEVWVSEALAGVAAGNPAVSSDGAYVFLTHNADAKTNGHFTILDGATGAVFFGGSSGEGDQNPTKRYSPVGIYHTPESGNYDPIVAGSPVSEGDKNTNDMLLWSESLKPTDTSVSDDGNLYGFQFPREFAGNASEINYFQMGSVLRDFASDTAPVLTNKGLSAYWGVTRSSFRAWVSKRFTRARNHATGGARNDDFRGQSVWAQPTLSNDGPKPTVFGGTAAREFIRMDYDFENIVIKQLDSYVKTAAVVDRDERVVYYVESESGKLHQASMNNLNSLWTEEINFSVSGEMCITPRSDVLIIADTKGVISGFQVAEIPTTEAPSDMPSDGPSMEPTMAPSISSAPVDPTESPTASPVAPTDAPVVPPTDAPIDAPVAPVTVVVDPAPAPEDSGSVRSLAMAFAALVVTALLL